ncbi:MAG: hypothetical protein ACKVH9_05895, partial [Rhodobacterales bacterium]
MMMGKIKIIWIFNTLNYGNGPLQRVLRLDKEKYEIHFVVLRGSKRDAYNAIGKLGYCSEDINVITDINIAKINIKNIICINKIITEIKPHIIQSTSIWSGVIVTAIKMFSPKIKHVTFDGGMLDRYGSIVRLGRAISSIIAEKNIFISNGTANSRNLMER